MASHSNEANRHRSWQEQLQCDWTRHGGRYRGRRQSTRSRLPALSGKLTQIISRVVLTDIDDRSHGGIFFRHVIITCQKTKSQESISSGVDITRILQCREGIAARASTRRSHCLDLFSHKGPRVREMIESVHATLKCLPQYCPDFNPIEKRPNNLKLCYDRPPSAPSAASGQP